MMEILKEQAVKRSKDFSNICDLDCIPIDYINRKFITDERPEICCECDNQKCNLLSVYLYGCHEAYRWGGMYIYHCQIGLVLVASSISSDEGVLEGGIVAGPMCMGSKDDLQIDNCSPELKERISKMPIRSTQMVQSRSKIMAMVTSEISGISHGKSGRYYYSQEKFLNTVYSEGLKFAEQGDYYTYPIASERKLRDAIMNKDKDASQVLLNQILAYMYVSNNADLEAIIPRIIELIVVISRAAVDAGADINDIFHLNQNFLAHIQEFKTIEDLSAWVSSLLHRFISDTFDFADIKHADVVYKTMEYIKQNYNTKLTLDQISEVTHLSKTYLSSIFKKETGQSISSYINMIRVDKSKGMLLESNLNIIDIANASGFEDQSYYTKVFKNHVGITPKKFRENRGMVK